MRAQSKDILACRLRSPRASVAARRNPKASFVNARSNSADAVAIDLVNLVNARATSRRRSGSTALKNSDNLVSARGSNVARWDRNESARARRVRAQDDEARLQPEGRGARQWNQPRAFAPLRLREHTSDPEEPRVADRRPPTFPSTDLLTGPDCAGLALGHGGDEGRRISQRRGPLPADWGCISPEAFCRRRRSRHR